MQTYYVDGQFVAASEAVIPVDDLAIMRGFGVFDLLRTLNGHPLFRVPALATVSLKRPCT